MYNLKGLTAFFHSFIITMIMVLSEMVFWAILSHFISDFYNNTTYFRNVIILSVPSKILYFFILQSISLFIGKRKTRELSSDKSTLFLAWFHTYIQEKNQEFLEMQLRLQKEYDNVKYFDALRKQDEKEKILIHDIRKHLMSIAELNERKETQKIASYVELSVTAHNDSGVIITMINSCAKNPFDSNLLI